MITEMRELIQMLKLHLQEEYDEGSFVIAEGELPQPIPKKEVRTVPVPPPPRVAPPPRQVAKRINPLPVPVAPKEELVEAMKAVDDFQDIRRFFETRYPNIVLQTPQMPAVQIGVIAGTHPVINQLLSALEKQFGGAKVVPLDELEKYPSLKLVIDHTGLSTFDPTLKISDLDELQKTPSLKRELWNAIKQHLERIP